MPLGIAHSRFLAWDADDQDKALAYTRAKAELCPSCGTRESDWYDDEGRFHDPPRVEPWVVSCPGCRELDRERDALDEADKTGTAVSVVVMPFDPSRREKWEAAYREPGSGSGWGQDVAPEEPPA